MQLQGQIEHTPVLSNVGETYKYKIQQSAKAFAVLSSCYSNKIRAIVREIACNGVDSHVAAGKHTVPICVHLPSGLEPWFSVTDFGVGLDATEVENVFTTYFASTKSDSNEYIGALGLGSKSPFCKVQNFTVMATKDGYTRVFSAFMDESGEPNVALMTEQVTNFPSGVEVTVPVDDVDDFYKYANEAQYIFQHFKVQPIITGNSNYRPSQIRYLKHLIGKTYLRYAETNGYHDHRKGCFAIMGSVAYPIDIPNSRQVLGDLVQYLTYPIDIHFEIGELDILPSRENLSYIPLTIDAIKNKLQELSDSLYNKLTTDLTTLDNEWNKLKYASALTNDASKIVNPSLVKLFAVDPNQLKLVKEINTRYDNHLYVNCKFPKFLVTDLTDKFNLKLTAFSSTSGYSRRTAAYIDKISDSTTSFIHNTVSKLDPTKTETYFEFRGDSGVIIINDLTKPTTIKSRITHNIAKILTQFQISKKELILFIANAVDDKPIKGYEFAKECYDFKNIILASTLELPARKPRVKLVKKVSYLTLEIRNNGSMIWQNDNNDIALLDQTKQHYYSQLKGFDFVSDYGFTNFKEFYAFIQNVLPNSGISLNNTIAVRTDSAITAVQQMKNFKDINVAFREQLIANKDHISKAIAFNQLLISSNNNSGLFYKLASEPYNEAQYHSAFDKICDGISAESTFKKFWITYKEFTANIKHLDKQSVADLQNYRRALQFISKFDMENTVDSTIELEKMTNTLQKQMDCYPMLRILIAQKYSNDLISPSRLTEYIKYINLVDSAVTK